MHTLQSWTHAFCQAWDHLSLLITRIEHRTPQPVADVLALVGCLLSLGCVAGLIVLATPTN